MRTNAPDRDIRHVLTGLFDYYKYYGAIYIIVRERLLRVEISLESEKARYRCLGFQARGASTLQRRPPLVSTAHISIQCQ